MISVTILVKNGEGRIGQVLHSLKKFSEIILVDTGSTDQTLPIAKKFPNVKIFERPFTGFGPLHNEAAQLAQNNWILSIDADEVLTEELSDEIFSLKLDIFTVYELPFINFYHGKKILWCGWYPENHVRLYHRQKTNFTEMLVHEGIDTTDMKKQRLHHPIHHYSYEKISDFLIKMERYSTLFALQNAGKKASSPSKALAHGMAAFFKSFILKKGFLGGYEGLLISCYNAHTAFYKYLKLYEANARQSHVSPDR
jgi:glycosyltransferase involved in cell wall biosynthesis